MVRFTEAAWRHIDPAPYVGGWHIEAICDHLEAVTRRQIKRLLITVPPRSLKTTITAVTWPAWTWIQPEQSFVAGPQVKFLFSSYSQTLSEGSSRKTRRLIGSDWYRQRWGSRVELRDDADTVRKFELTAGGYRLATSVDGTLTGEGGMIIVVDDPLNAKQANYRTVREAANLWWDEALPTRLDDPINGAKVVIMQRLHQDDLAGHIMDRDTGGEWTELCIPMEYDPARSFVTTIGWQDPRTEAGELMCPARWPAAELATLKADLGPFGVSSQLQQSPSPRGGGIVQRDWWQLWPPTPPEDGHTVKYPPVSFVALSVDTALGQKEENDWNACTAWGVFHDDRHKLRPSALMMEAWRARLPLRAQASDEPLDEAEKRKRWGLTEKIIDTARRRKADIILIEDKTRSKDLHDELRRLLRPGECSILLLPVVMDKVARLHAVVSMFADGLIYAPDRIWAEEVIDEVIRFPRGKWDDYCDTVSQALSWLRQNAMLRLATEPDPDEERARNFKLPRPVYDV